MRSERPAHFVAFAAFSAWVLFKVFTHVPWRDELQALLIAREAGGFGGLYHNLAYEGHPGLWHLILMGVSQLSGEPAILPWVQAPIALGILALIWFAMPFGWLEKALLSASYYISFEYGVMARAYGLGVLLFLGAVALRHSPWAWVMLGLMANISIHFMLLGGVFGLLLLWRRQRSSWGIVTCLSLVAVAVATAWPAADYIPAFPQADSGIGRFLKALCRMSGALAPISAKYVPGGYWDAILFEAKTLGLAVTGLLTAVLAVAIFYRRQGFAALVAIFCLGMLVIGTVLFNGWNRHYGLVLILVVALHWIARSEGLRRSYLLTWWLIVSATAGMWTAYWSTGVPFSEGRAVAAWIQEHELKNEFWAAYPGAIGIDLTAHLAVPTYNVEAGRMNTFMRWNYVAQIKRPVDEISSLLDRVPMNTFYLISEPEWFPPESIAALSDGGIDMQEIARFDNLGATFKFVAYRVSTDH